jgi:hypothetical protein
MKRQQALQRLQDMLEPDLAELISNAILPDDDGYMAFGIYYFRRDRDHWDVYKRQDLQAQFSNIKIAVSWAIADKYQQYGLGRDLVNLDIHRRSLSADIEVRAGLSKKITDSNRKESVDLKIYMRKQRLKDVETRLTKCVNVAKYWQIRGFNNETARLGRTTSHKTNR